MTRSRIKKDFVKTALDGDVGAAKLFNTLYSEQILPVVGLALSRAGSMGHDEYVKWIVETFPRRLNKEYIQNTQMIVTLCYSGHSELFDWFFEKYYPTEEDLNIFPFYVTFIVACKHNKLDLLDKICNIPNPNRYDLPFIEGMHIAAKCAHHQIFRYIIENFNTYKCDINEELILSLCESGQLGEIEWVLNRFKMAFCKDDGDNLEIFVTIIKSGNIELADYFVAQYEQIGGDITRIKITEKAWYKLLCDLCVKSYLDMARWVIKKLSTSFNQMCSESTFANIDTHVFRICLESRSLTSVLWFIDIFDLMPIKNRKESLTISKSKLMKILTEIAINMDGGGNCGSHKRAVGRHAGFTVAGDVHGRRDGRNSHDGQPRADFDLMRWFIEFYNLLSISIVPHREINLSYKIEISDLYLSRLCKNNCLHALELFINEYGLDKNRCLNLCREYKFLDGGQDLVDHMKFTNQDIAEFIDLLPPFE